jgi:hypothetical protein
VCESEDLRARPVQISWLVDYVVAILLDKLQRKPGVGNQVGVDRESGEGFALYQGTTSVGPLRRNKIKGQISLCPLWPDLKSCPDTKQTPPPCTAIRAFMHGPVFPGNRKISNLNSSEVQPSPFDKLRAGSAGLSLEMEFSRPFLALVSPVFCCTIEAVPFVKTAGPAPP